MAIYGDGKHNENMEYNAPKFQVVDKTVYRTTYWRVKSENYTYYVRCEEGDMYDTWYIESKEGNIDTNTELGQELIATCETYEDWKMDSDERYDGEGEDGAK